MKRFIYILLITGCFVFTGLRSVAQVVTVDFPTRTTPNLLPTYGSLAAAITALSNITAITGGPVIITLKPLNNQTTPAGGYVIDFTAVTTAVNTITIEGSGNTITAYSPQSTGRIFDAIFSIIGSDYVTIQNFVMRENPSNTTIALNTNNMTEWGVALFKLSTTNGAQNNTIQNNTISLNKAYPNSYGIYSNSNHTSTDANTSSQPSNITGANSGNKVYSNTISNVNMGVCFVGSRLANYMDIGNDVGGTSSSTGNTITNWGALTQTVIYYSSSGSCYGINLDNQKGENASYNTITSAAFTGATPVSIRGIFKDYNTNPSGTFTTNITNNTITINYGFTGSSTCEGINTRSISGLSTATININSNTLSNISIGAVSTPNLIGISNDCVVGNMSISNNTITGTSIASATSSFTGISNTGASTIMNINSNIIRGTTSSASGNFVGIINNAAIVTTLNINSNKIGDAVGNAITYSGANAANLTGITVPTVASTAAVSISNNNFQGFAQTVAGSGAHTYINLNHASSTATTDNLNNNTFTNLVANTSGAVIFIKRDGTRTLSSGAIENCNNNSIVTAFSKPTAGGTVTLYSALGGSLSGTSMVQTGNNFSNITLTGATSMQGWVNYEGGTSGPVKTFTNNTFSNWVCGSGAAFVIQSNAGDNGTTFSNNTISNISGTGGILGIDIAAGSKGAIQTYSNNTISDLNGGVGLVTAIICNTPLVSVINLNNNTISGITSAFAATFSALRINNAATANLFRNKIYDMSGTAAASAVAGIEIRSSNTGICNIYNNLIGDLRAPIGTTGNAVRGIMISSISATAAHNVYYNTIYLNATSSGLGFGSSGISVVADAAAGSGPTSLRNNIIINNSISTGSGFTVAYRRSDVDLGNYAAASNNNIFYAGTPTGTNFIFADGTNGDLTLAAFKARVSPREAASFTELTSFLSLTGASPDFLHIDASVPTQAESGAVNIAGYTADYDTDIRQGNAGYIGTGTAPDIGADEREAIISELIPPVISYTVIPSPACIFSGMTITGVTISDATGVALSGATRPRIYYRKNAGTWFSAAGTNTSGTINSSVWSFTIVETDMGGVAGGDIISYYIIAQDLNAVPNVISNPATGLVASSVTSVTTHPTTPNTYTLRYSMSGTYTVGTGGDFTTLTAAVNAYNNACALTGPTIFELINNTYPSETFPIDIQLHADASAIHTLTIRPSATATPVITGSATQIINLNGAKYITIDGRQAGAGTTKSLTISNTNLAGITVQFINDAQNDILKYCIFKGVRVSANSGTIVFGIANPTGTGNDNNTIDNNDITDGTSQPNNAIFSMGSPGQENSNNAVTNNNISNFFNPTSNPHGIFLNNNNNSWTISGNRFFQTATRINTGANINWGIYIVGGSGFTVTNNIIGFANASGTGTTNLIGNTVTLPGFPVAYTPTGTSTSLRYVGIGVSLDLGAPSNIDGNTIGGIAMYTANASATLLPMFCGIYVESGTVNIGANAGNIIGATSGTNSIYVATSGAGGAVFGIKASSILNVAIQNNTIGSITVSGTSAAVSGSFTGISAGGLCNYTISNNAIGNADVDNIRIGYAITAGQLSNTGTLTPTNAGVTTILKGITSGGSGNTLSITNNTLRGWVMSCGNIINTLNLTGIETTGALTSGSPAVNVNNNFFGTSSTNWVNATVANLSTFYGINVGNSNATVTNIKNNDFQGSMFGTQNAVGGGLIRLTGASSANNIATISGNTFTNMMFRFSGGDLYFIYSSYTLAPTGQIIIDNNRSVGTFSGTGLVIYHVLNLFMGSATGAKADISNNNFSNFTTTGINSGTYLLYTSFTLNSCLLNVTGNVFNNFSFGNGSFLNGIDIADMSGTANCSNNTITNITGQGYMTGITLDPSSGSGQFNVTNNTISGFASTGAGGFINGITGNFSPAGATQTTIDHNTISGLSSTNLNGDVAGIYLDNGFAASTVSVTKNKIYDLSESAAGSNVYGINNYTSLRGNLTYSNNYIGDLRAPNSNVSGPAVTGLKLSMLVGQANVYYNTIHLNATGTGSIFSTAAVYADGATAITLRNNIFSNISGHGATGRTVAYWRSNNSLITYNATSNNNLFYAGTAAAQNLIYYDGSNSDQTLLAYKARVTPRDNVSVSALPGFISTLGSNINFLHISTSGNCSVNATGNNAAILLSSDFDNDIRSTTSPFVTDIGADEFSKKNAWTGVNGTNWNDTGNWSEGVVPDTDDDNVVISTPPVNQPIIASGEQYQVGSLIMGSGATLTNRGTIKVSGYIYATAGSINNIQAGVVEGSIEMNGNCAIIQPLAGNVFAGNSVKKFTVSNDVNISGALGEHLNISRALSFGAVTGKVLNTGDNVVLLSTVAATANVTDVTGNSISGKATVERFIHTGVSGGAHAKGWQFLATPTQGQTIFQSWQESGTTPAGYGTIITGTGSGFDQTTATPSMKLYDPNVGANGAWVGVTSTAGLLNDQRGYMLFVRGDRTVTTLLGSANQTNMRTQGTLYQPNNPPPVTSVPAGKYASVGNPYASTIGLEYMRDNGGFVNLNNDVVVWDPLLYGSYNFGGYQTLSSANNYEPTAGGSIYYTAGDPSPFIQSGQAFFVQSSGLPGTVTFTEASKKDTTKLVNRQTDAGSRQYFRAGLFTNAGTIADGNAVVFGNSYSNTVDADDAIKFINSGENFMISRQNKKLSVEARSIPEVRDTIFYTLANLRRQSYRLSFAPKNMQAGDLKAYLIDKYLQTTTELNLADSNFVNIEINDDALSAGERFFVVFQKITLVPVRITSISASRNADKTIRVKWRTENEINIDNYSLESSADGQNFAGIISKNALTNNGSAASYQHNDPNPYSGNNFYRVRATGISGQIQYSAIVKVAALEETASIVVYPNPVENKTVHVHFVNQASGIYKLTLTNKVGQVVYKGNVEISDSNISRSIVLNQSLAAGNYQCSVIAADGKKTVQQIIIR